MDHFQNLLKQYEAMIHHIIHSLHIYKNYDEFYQIGLIALWEADGRFDASKGAFTSFAYKTIKGRLLSELNKSVQMEERQLYPREEYWGLIIDELKEPLEMETLLSYCEGLTTKQKRWVIATFYLGMNSNEIAAFERVSMSAVKKWKKGAMERIKRKMQHM